MSPLRPLRLAALALMLSFAPRAEAAKIRLAWIDLISEDSGTWLNYDLPMLGATPGTTGMRFLYQVQPVIQTPFKNLYLGVSLQSQSIHYERDINVSLGKGELGLWGGLQTRLFMPEGLMTGLRWNTGRLRLAGGVSAVSPSTWRRPAYKVWSVMPTLGLSILIGKQEQEGRRFRSEPVDRTGFRSDGIPPVEPAPGTPMEAAPVDGAPLEAPPTALPPGEAPTGVVLPPAEVALPAPTGPVEVQFESPTQVFLPGDAPIEVQIGGQEEDKDESSQDKDEDEGQD